MPSIPEHYDQSIHNITFSSSFSQQDYADWAITSRFYAAVHLVRAWLMRFNDIDNSKIDTHTKVDEQLRLKPFDRRKMIAYRELSSLSRNARYDCFPISDLVADVSDAQRLYEELRDYIRPQIAGHLPAPTKP